MAKVVYKPISPTAPMGGPVVDVRINRPEAPGDAAAAAVKCERWWHESSYELRTGLDVTEDDPQTIPGDLLDLLFKA